MDVLIVCTGNICRSPMAEVLLDAELRRRGVAATVASAGLLDDGLPADPHAIAAMGDRDLDLAAHASRRMTVEMLERADLMIGMERRHVREAAVLAPSAYPRMFTLRELAHRAAAVGPRGDEPVERWLASLAEDRSTAVHLGSSSQDDVADPVGRGARAFRKCADELEALVSTTADLLWPAPTADSSDPVRSATA